MESREQHNDKLYQISGEEIQEEESLTQCVRRENVSQREGFKEEVELRAEADVLLLGVGR